MTTKPQIDHPELIVRYGLFTTLILCLGALAYALLSGKPGLATAAGIFALIFGVALFLHIGGENAERRIIELLEIEHECTEIFITHRLLNSTSPEEIHAALNRLRDRGLIRVHQRGPRERITFSLIEQPSIVALPD